MEAEFAREREMERKESEARAREADRLLKERTREWERHERCAPPRLPPGTAAVTLRLPAAQAVDPCGRANLHLRALSQCPCTFDVPLCGCCQMPAACCISLDSLRLRLLTSRRCGFSGRACAASPPSAPQSCPAAHACMASVGLAYAPKQGQEDCYTIKISSSAELVQSSCHLQHHTTYQS